MAVTYPKILLSIFACIYFTCDVFASQIPIGHVMQKTVAALTGRAAEDVLTAGEIKQFESGKLTLAEVAELARQSPYFTKHLANFWTEKFEIFELVQWEDNYNMDRPEGDCTATRPCNFSEEVTRYYGEGADSRRRLSYNSGVCRNTVSDDDMTGEGTFMLVGRVNSSHEDYRLVVDPRLDGDCFGRTTLVKPWWAANPADYVRVGLKASQYCGGADLADCFPTLGQRSILEQGHYTYHRRLRYGFTMQPGMLVAMQTQELKPWEQAITTDQVPVNGALADFLHRFNHSGDVGTMQFFKFPGAYPNINTSSVFKNADPQEADDWKWVTQGLASGVMSTFGFHRATDGRRAKFNRLYNSMLCSEFDAFPDSVPDPSDTNPDLTQRSGCKDCHRALDPASRYFANWPELGNNASYFYKPPDLEVKGSFLNQNGSGTPALAQVVKDSIPFHSCGVQRAFEFVMGREMSTDEKGRMMPTLLRIYREGGARIWPVMRHVVSSSYFTQGVK